MKIKIKFKKIYYFLFILIIILFFLLKQIYFVYQNQKNNYFNNIKNKDIQISIIKISKKLHNKKYGLIGGHWGKLLAHTFYGYSLVSLYLQNKEDKKFKKFTIGELEFILNYINSENGKKPFINKKTDIPLGIIYNGHKNQILASLVLLGENKYKKELYKNSDYIYSYLNKSISKNSQTYNGWSWYVDNVNAIYSLYITDLLREKDGLNKKYNILIKDWLSYMKKHIGKYGMIYSEAETPNLKYNQARGPALSWLLVYIYELDNELFKKQYKLYNKYFYDNFLGLGLSRNIPKGQNEINKIKAGPVIFGYSSSATILSLAMYKINNDKTRFYNTLKSINFLFIYNNGSYIFGKSTLIDSLGLWGKTKVTWGNKIKN